MVPPERVTHFISASAQEASGKKLIGRRADIDSGHRSRRASITNPTANQIRRVVLFGFISGINAWLQPHGDMLAGEASIRI